MGGLDRRASEASWGTGELQETPWRAPQAHLVLWGSPARRAGTDPLA